MPLYEYFCPAHGVFEGYAPMSASSELRACATCGVPSARTFRTPPRVFGDFEGYESPASGKWIEGRRARAEDFARTGTRPYELGEWKTNVLRAAQAEKQADAEIDESVEQTIGELRSN